MQTGQVEEYEIILPAISTAGLYLFTTSSGIQYEVRFGRKQDNILYATIVFGVINDEYEGEEYIETNKGELYRVMATIVKVVKMFITEHPNILFYEFTGIAREGEAHNTLTTRINLYKRYLSRIFDKQWSFDFSKGNTITVTRIRL